MKQPVPLPTTRPFLTVYTNTHRRPAALTRNLMSVMMQTAVADLEQIVLPDHVGYGIVGGLYGRIPWYAAAVRGRYVLILNDDDQFADERVVERLRAFATKRAWPPVIVGRVRKGDVEFPRQDPMEPPVEGHVDLGSYVLRRDVWLSYADNYGLRYQGDYDHAVALYEAGLTPQFADLLVAVGPASGGRGEL